MLKQKQIRQRIFRLSAGLGLASLGLFNLALPVLALGTEAGTVISNTATASYSDGTTTYSTESNTVNVTVAKIAGITNTPSGFRNLGTAGTPTVTGAGAGGTILTGHNVEYIFTITNTGNDLSDIVIPASSTLALQGLNPTLVSYEYSTDDGATYTTATAGVIVPDVAIDGEILVRVVGTVTATAAGAPVSVRLGDTGSNLDANAPLPETQNQPDAFDGINANEVSTQTADGAGVAVPGAPANGQREASALALQFLGSNPLALARVLKTNTGVAPGATTALNDNVITYNLSLEVENVSPNPLYIPADLEGRALNVTGVPDNTNLILVSDAIPALTTLDPATAAANVSAPAGWTRVYTGSSTTTVPNASDAVWNTNPLAVGTITRVGWVYDARTTAIARGATVTGFSFNVTTTGLVGPLATTGADIFNIGQVFGSTNDGNPATNTGAEVFDESGDQDPANFNGSNLGPTENAAESDGVGDPGNHNTDTNNDNSVVGDPGGEDNVISVLPPGTILNGPGGQPAASGNIFGIGPDNNHDFQNKSALPAATDPTPDQGTTVDPAAIVFNNTLSNPDPTNTLNNVLLQPIQPAFAGGLNTDLPVGTTVRLDIVINGVPTFATYTYNGTQFNITAGTPILIPGIAPGVTLDYTTTVNLPVGTPLSTDQVAPGTNANLIGGFPVPIIAFIDGDSDGTPDVGETSNITVDQVYTGFLRLLKQSRILQGAGPTVAGTDGTFSSAAKTAAPGNTIEYRVVYRNISEPQAGTGTNATLVATNVVITEDGTGENGNWALDASPADGTLDTLNIINSAATTSAGATINFATGSPAATFGGTIDPGVTTTGYRATIPSVAPTGAVALTAFDVGTAPVPAGFFSFTFQRQVAYDVVNPPAP